MRALPDDVTPMEVIAFIHCLDSDGHSLWVRRYSEGVGSFEAIGVLDVMQASARAELVDGMIDED